MKNIFEELTSIIFNWVDKLELNFNIELYEELKTYTIDDFLELGEFLKSLGDEIIKESIKGNLEV